MVIRALCILFLCSSCCGMLYAARYASHISNSKGYVQFLFLFLSIFIYTVGYTFELSSDTADTIFLALKFEYLGCPFIPVFWVLFSLAYNNYKISRKTTALLFVIPVVTIIMLYTNGHHFFHYKSFAVDSSGPFPVAAIEKGWWYYTDFAYKMILTFIGIALFGISAANARGYRKKQGWMLFAGALAIWTGNFLAVLGVAPYGLDITPFFLSTAMPACGYAMYRLRMFDLVPIARDQVFQTISVGVIVLDRQKRIIDFNEWAASMLPGLTEDTLGSRLNEIFPEADALETAAANADTDTELTLHVNGALRCFSFAQTRIQAGNGQSKGVIISLHDITENKKLLDNMSRIASFDALTQVCSRWFFMEACLKKLQETWRNRQPFALLLVDIDHFKKINDEYGHMAGDMVLKTVTDTFRHCLREHDILGRYGGEEFIMALPGIDREGAIALAERLRQEAAAAVTGYDNARISVTISLGIAATDFCGWHQEPADFELVCNELIKASDTALYEAKQQGRNMVRTVALLPDGTFRPAN